MSATTLLLAPAVLTLAPGGTASVGAWAWDGAGDPILIPNGTQVRVDDVLVATASLSGSVVTVTGVSPGSTGVSLTKGNVQSNIVTTFVRSMPASISIRFP